MEKAMIDCAPSRNAAWSVFDDLVGARGHQAQSVDIPGHFLGQGSVNQALSLEPGLVLKGRGDDFDSKMGLAARP